MNNKRESVRPTTTTVNEDHHSQDSQLSQRVYLRPGVVERTLSSESEKIRKGLGEALALAVDNSGKTSNEGGQDVFMRISSLTPATNHSWLSGLFDPRTLHKLFVAEAMGNYVINRRTGKKEWESMPIYARIGMHLLFYGPAAVRFVTWSWIRKVLREQSIQQGKNYDSTDTKLVQSQIRSFVVTYGISTSELLERDLKKYPTFNSFFSRRLKPAARPPAFPKDAAVIGSAADSRLTVFHTVAEATTFWIKGRMFTISSLLRNPKLTASVGKSPSLAIWRLAPQDYHRFHSPVSGTIRSIKHIPGEYYTVNPQAINEDLDVFTANTRSIAVIDAKFDNSGTTWPVAIVAVGALLVGSIGWDKNPGDPVLRCDGLGYFAYGGSTVIGVFPEGADIQWDDDLRTASLTNIEVLVKAGEKIGRVRM